MSVYIKRIQERNYVTDKNHQPIVLFKCAKCCLASGYVTVPFLKYVTGQWSNDIIVNIHCDVTVSRWCCLGNHISQQSVGDVAATQGGTSV